MKDSYSATSKRCARAIAAERGFPRRRQGACPPFGRIPTVIWPVDRLMETAHRGAPSERDLCARLHARRDAFGGCPRYSRSASLLSGSKATWPAVGPPSVIVTFRRPAAWVDREMPRVQHIRRLSTAPATGLPSTDPPPLALGAVLSTVEDRRILDPEPSEPRGVRTVASGYPARFRKGLESHDGTGRACGSRCRIGRIRGLLREASSCEVPGSAPVACGAGTQGTSANTVAVP
jgi:hypothetical protein